jgi:hypothetical protein
MVSALENIRTKPTLPDFNESANTLEKLAILKAWAQVFIAAIDNGLSTGDSLNDMLKYATFFPRLFINRNIQLNL